MSLSHRSSRSSLHVPGADDADFGELPPGAGTVYEKWTSVDPRSSSTQSLAPSVKRDGSPETRRTLLAIYIHGFMGNDSSFRSFPAHVHSYLKNALEETHVIHSKIYPRYKTYRAIEVARDNFSKWLEPHESDATDIVLLGHSMGGLLAAEIVLIPGRESEHPFKHRILGSICLDAPFLGLHPGIVVAGIASLFRKAPNPPQDAEPGETASFADSQLELPSQPLSPDPSVYSDLTATTSGYASTSATTLSPVQSSTSTNDPYFNPPFFNDVLFKDRGWWKNVAHFAKKHKPEGVVSAARHHILNHLEFGACLMDFVALNQRYDKVRRLEDVNDLDMSSGQGGLPRPRKDARVRFVNYYTISTGRRKSPSPGRKRKDTDVHLKPAAAASGPASSRTSLDTDSRATTPRISIEDHSDGRIELLHVISPGDPLPEPVQGADHDTASDAPEELDDIPEAPEPESPEAHTLPHATSDSNAPAAVSTDAPSGSDATDDAEAAPSPAAGKVEVDTNEAAATPVTETAPQPRRSSDPAGDEAAALGIVLPPIPPLPEFSKGPDLDAIADKDLRKQAEKEARRAQKAYEQAVKNRDRAIKERQRLLEKQRKKAAKETEKLAKADDKKRRQDEAALKKAQDAEARKAAGDEQPPPPPLAQKGRSATGSASQKEPARPRGHSVASQRDADELTRALQRQASEAAKASSSSAAGAGASSSPTASSPPSSPAAEAKDAAKPAKKPRDRKFITLPRRVAVDPTWVEVRMEGVDEVGAHCGLFFAGPRYEVLVHDVGERVVGWVHDDASRRAVLALRSEYEG